MAATGWGIFPPASTGDTSPSEGIYVGDIPPGMAGVDLTRLRAALTARELSPRAASLEAGLGAYFLRDVMSGKSKSPRTDTLTKLANLLHVSVPYLLGEDAGADSTAGRSFPGHISRLPIRDRAQAGAWIRADETVQEAYGYEEVVPDPQFPEAEQWLDIVVGDSMDRLRIFDGDLVRVVSAAAIGYHPRANDVVVIVRSRYGGQELERSIKQVQLDSRGRPEFWPRSSNPKYQKPISLSEGANEGEVEVRVEGWVRQVIRTV